jgi:predicted RNA binding protein YcfA (HicA-like mRNA interferase family)
MHARRASDAVAGWISMTGEPYAAATREPDRPDDPFTRMSGEFPSLKARQLLRILGRLGYRVSRQGGSSHRWLAAEGRPVLRFAYHDRETIRPCIVRLILVKEAGLTVEEVLKVVHND